MPQRNFLKGPHDTISKYFKLGNQRPDLYTETKTKYDILKQTTITGLQDPWFGTGTKKRLRSIIWNNNVTLFINIVN